MKHLIDSGNDPHTVMAFRRHRTPSMLRRYHLIDLDDLHRAAEHAAAYQGPGGTVEPLRSTTLPQNRPSATENQAVGSGQSLS